MKTLRILAFATTLVGSAMMFAQDKVPDKANEQADRPAATASSASRTFTGTIVNADCSQAAALKSAPGTYSADAAKEKSKENMKSIYDLQREVIGHCAAKKETSAFALVSDDGQFFKLDDAGNTQVKSNAGKKIKDMKVSVSGAATGDTLQVATLTRTDAAK